MVLVTVKTMCKTKKSTKHKTSRITSSRKVGKRIRPNYVYNLHRQMSVAQAITYCLIKRNNNYEDRFVTENSPGRRIDQPLVYNINKPKLVENYVIESSLDVIMEEDEPETDVIMEEVETGTDVIMEEEETAIAMEEDDV
ncbi:hypothetical protein J6590_056033 [Homalodisca vitripennis]|nr:hypothetical protein J6590_056033 [Homalodisca vitripennis]